MMLHSGKHSASRASSQIKIKSSRRSRPPARKLALHQNHLGSWVSGEAVYATWNVLERRWILLSSSRSPWSTLPGRPKTRTVTSLSWEESPGGGDGAEPGNWHLDHETPPETPPDTHPRVGQEEEKGPAFCTLTQRNARLVRGPGGAL